MNRKRAFLLASALSVILIGAYALICWFTDTWKDAPPSGHITAMVWCVIGSGIAAIILSGDF